MCYGVKKKKENPGELMAGNASRNVNAPFLQSIPNAMQIAQ